MKINAIDIRKGNAIFHDSKLWTVAKTMHTQPGKGGAYIQVEMKGITDDTKCNIRFRSSETVEKARLDKREYQFLYINNNKIELMDNDDYEQIAIDIELLQDNLSFLTEGILVTLEFYENMAISASLPETLQVKVKECEPTLKGQTTAASYKSAILENGVRIMVPPFINQNDEIIIRLLEREYKERA